MSSNAVEIILQGRTYSIACPPGQEATLKMIAEQLEGKLAKLKGRTHNVNREELIMMAALNIGYELFEEKQKNKDYMQQMDQRINVLQSTLDNALAHKAPMSSTGAQVTKLRSVD